MVEFFAPMNPPTVTAQQKGVRVVNGKPVFYEKPEVKAARTLLTIHLARHRPKKPMQGAVRLLVVWRYPRGKHPDRSWRITRPDTDNIQKLLKDVMTDLGYWRDDAQVASELVEKIWSNSPGIYVKAEEMVNDGLES